jgi:hypothetical protein
MSDRKPSDICRSVLEKEREQIKLTEGLLVSLELMEMDDTFFDMEAVSGVEVTHKQVTFSHKDGTTKSYRTDAVPTSFLEQYRNSREQVNTRLQFGPAAHELMRRKREAKTILQ